MFISQAYKGNNEWWRVAITTFLTAGIFIGNFIMYFVMTDEQMNEVYESMKDIPSNISLIMNLLPFVFLLGLLFGLVHFLHNRSILSLTTSKEKVEYKRVFFSFGLVVLLSILTFVVSYSLDSSNIVWNFQPLNFMILLIISLILFPFQIGLEEYLFRGYLMQQIGIIAKNRWLPLVITSIIFGLFHSANPEVAEMGYGVIIFYIGTGFLLGIMTLMDESIELALGFHLGNNLMAALLITSDYSALQTDAIFKYSNTENSNDMLNEMIVTMAIIYPIILFTFARRYKWTNWKEKLSGNISYPNA